MRLDIADRIGYGQRADIIAPSQGARVYKVFRRNVKAAPSSIASRSFASETSAYSIAVTNPSLRLHVPEYFGAVRVSEVCDIDGKDVSDQYWLDFCFAMERLVPDPEEIKVGYLFEGPDWHLVSRLVELFDEAGIDLADASVLYRRTATPVFIDLRLNEGASAS